MDRDLFDHLFIVQPYRAKAERLVAQPAQVFADERSARSAGGRLARYRAGVVIASQSFDPVTGQRKRPQAIVVHGRVPAEWGRLGQAA